MERIKVSSKQVEQLLPAQAIIDMKQALMVVDALLDAQLTADLAEHERVVREIFGEIENLNPKITDYTETPYRLIWDTRYQAIKSKYLKEEK